jgi:hypothetical protein
VRDVAQSVWGIYREGEGGVLESAFDFYTYPVWLQAILRKHGRRARACCKSVPVEGDLAVSLRVVSGSFLTERMK